MGLWQSCQRWCGVHGHKQVHKSVFPMNSPLFLLSLLHTAQARPSAGAVRVFAVSAAPATKPAAAVNVVTEAHGFKLQRQQFVREYDSTVLLYKHEKTGEGGTLAR